MGRGGAVSAEISWSWSGVEVEEEGAGRVKELGFLVTFCVAVWRELCGVVPL